ncbi:hypothetical protein [Rhizobium sp. 11515TR]|uniref:hypothetical protein n=1 Tax=Rhizobium sp. 11515TR TaxID=2028343 RepID=UPI000BA8C4A6|nr:hypothetical protein [Rhizobium sp. 11515TR]ASW06269.1 hypothetical protein CKA34_10490 [Rhizobium sp. 11515TR]
MIKRPENSYDLRPNSDGSDYWTVYDIFTGQPAIVNGTIMDALEMEEADDLVDLLNAEYISRRSGPTH